jgi:uncharacterized membrane-anchored protein
MIIMVVILTIGILPMEIDTQNPLAEAAVGTYVSGVRHCLKRVSTMALKR